LISVHRDLPPERWREVLLVEHLADVLGKARADRHRGGAADQPDREADPAAF